MSMRENVLGITISRGGDTCRRRQWLGGREEPLSHLRDRGMTPEAGESFHLYPVIPYMKL